MDKFYIVKGSTTEYSRDLDWGAGNKNFNWVVAGSFDKNECKDLIEILNAKLVILRLSGRGNQCYGEDFHERKAKMEEFDPLFQFQDSGVNYYIESIKLVGNFLKKEMSLADNFIANKSFHVLQDNKGEVTPIEAIGSLPPHINLPPLTSSVDFFMQNFKQDSFPSLRKFELIGRADLYLYKEVGNENK